MGAMTATYHTSPRKRKLKIFVNECGFLEAIILRRQLKKKLK